LTAYNGKTIDILNTDAEGRLILDEGLSSISKHYKLDGLVDFATLTGAVVVALGHRYSGLLTNDQDFADELINVGKKSQDRVWQLPLDDEYAEDIKSKIADVKNTGAGRSAGTISAGAFLREFVGEDIPWCHVDIAGSGWLTKGRSYLPDGPSGAGVRLIMELIQTWSK
jgi:leucyl aminopeptidase